MFLSSMFGVKPVDEADDASTERDYPALTASSDNAVLDNIRFTPTLKRPAKVHLTPETELLVDGKTKAEGKGKENRGEKKLNQNSNLQGLASKRGRKLRACKECGEVFTWVTKLQEHARTHPTGAEDVKTVVKRGGGGLGGLKK